MMALYYFPSLFAVATIQFETFSYYSNDKKFLRGYLTAGETFQTDVLK